MTIKEIKEKLSLGALMAYYGHPPPGRNNQMKCPFHEDQSPSMKLYPETNTAYCFATSCQTHGRRISVIDWVKFQENLPDDQAAVARCREIIQELYGDGTSKPTKIIKPLILSKSMDDTQEKPELPHKERVKALELAFSYFQNAFPRSPEAMQYVSDRHLSGKGLEVGFNSGQFHHRRDQKTLAAFEALGLVTKTSRGYQVWGKDCIILPIRNAQGEIVSLYGRYIYASETKKHYYLRGRTGLYPGYPDAHTEVLIITESPLDAASLPPLPDKYAAVTGYSASSWPEELSAAIASLPDLKEVVFWFDGDASGRKGVGSHSEKLRNYLESHPPKFKVDALGLSAVPMPEGEDLNSLSGKEYTSSLFGRFSERVSIEAFAKLAPPEALSSASPSEAEASGPLSETGPPESGLDLGQVPHVWYRGEVVKICIPGGLPKNLSQFKSKVQIYPLLDGQALPSKGQVDFYEDSSLERMARQASRKLGLQVSGIEKDLEMLGHLAGLWRESQYRQEQSPQSNEEKWRQARRIEVNPSLDGEAHRFLSQKPQLIWAINHLLGKSGIVGQERQRILCYSIASTFNQSQTLHGLVRGSSGSGKTHLVKTVLECIPGTRVHPVTRSTSSSFYHFEPYELVGMVLKVEDWEGLDEASRYAIRELQSAGVLYNQTTVKSEDGKYETRTWKVFGPMVSLICTTEGELVRDNENRVFPIALDESPEQIARVVQYQNELSARLHDQAKMAHSKAFLTQVSALLKSYQVYNKYSPQVKLPPKVREPYRLNGMFQRLVNHLTVINQYQRSVHESGWLESQLVDLEDAVEIMFEAIVWRVDDLNSEQRKFLEGLKKYVKKASGLTKNFESYEFRQIQVRQGTAWPSRTVSEYLRQLVELEYIEITGGGGQRGRPQVYRIAHWQAWQAERERIKRYMLDQIDRIGREEGLSS